MNRNSPKNSANDHLANERTLLAWVRTSIGIITFGFVVFRFSLFLKQLTLLLNQKIELKQNDTTSYIGIALVILGTLTLLLSFGGYIITDRQIKKGVYQSSSLLLTLMIAFITIICLVLISHLLQTVN